MSARDPVTETMPETEAQAQWAGLLNQVSRAEKRVLIEQNGVPVAALVSVEDCERLVQFDRQREERFKALDRSRAAFKDVPDEELEAEVEKAVAEARAELREQRFKALDQSWEAFSGLADDEATIERKVAEAVAAARAELRKERRHTRAS